MNIFNFPKLIIKKILKAFENNTFLSNKFDIDKMILT